MKKIITAISSSIEDVLIMLGLVCIAAATFMVSFIGGLYITGAEFLGLGIWFTVYPPGKE